MLNVSNFVCINVCFLKDLKICNCVKFQDAVSILGGAIGAMRIPEKWFPGLVDYYLNSHNIMHVLVVVAVYSMHQVIIFTFNKILILFKCILGDC